MTNNLHSRDNKQLLVIVPNHGATNHAEKEERAIARNKNCRQEN
jgi:hypothetical protein